MAVTLKSAVSTSKANGQAPYVCLHIPAEAHTLSGFRAWVLSDALPEKLPVAFIKGEVYLDMSKQDLWNHVAPKGEIFRVLLQLNHDLELGEFFMDGPLVTNESAEVSNNPDGVGMLHATLDAGRVRYLPGRKGQEVEIEGSPDWVLEVVSDSSVHKDNVQLRQAYHKAGIREYWLVDTRPAEIQFQILHWRPSGYVAASPKAGWHRSKVWNRSFRLSRTRNRRGGWQYLLEVRE